MPIFLENLAQKCANSILRKKSTVDDLFFSSCYFSACCCLFWL